MGSGVGVGVGSAAATVTVVVASTTRPVDASSLWVPVLALTGIVNLTSNVPALDTFEPGMRLTEPSQARRTFVAAGNSAPSMMTSLPGASVPVTVRLGDPPAALMTRSGTISAGMSMAIGAVAMRSRTFWSRERGPDGGARRLGPGLEALVRADSGIAL